MAETQRPHEVAHPTPFTYLKVAMLLGALTTIEVVVFYIDALEPAFLAIFLILSVVKFAFVILFYMHLKFDSRLFSGVLIGGLLLAVAVGLTLMALFQVLTTVANPTEGPETVVGLPVESTPEPTRQPTAEPTPGSTVEPSDGPTAEPTATTTVEPPGQEIFLTVPENQALWCAQCHTIEGVAAGLIGPDLSHIGTDAATRKAGMSAEAYIRESIREPEEFICPAERCNPGLMTNAITGTLTDEQVEALVAYLLTLE